MDINATTVLVAVLGAGGLGAIFREVISGVAKIARGVALKESTRKIDLVTERDDALRRARRSLEGRDSEERNRRRVEAYAAHLQRIIILEGLDAQLPPRPMLEDTISREELRRVTGTDLGDD